MPAIKKNPCSNFFLLFHRFIVADFFAFSILASRRCSRTPCYRSSRDLGRMSDAFHEKDLESSVSVPSLPRVLSKIPALIFVGYQDLICNYICIENMIKALRWNGQTGLGVCWCVSFPSASDSRPDTDSIIRLHRHNRGISVRYPQVPGWRQEIWICCDLYEIYLSPF